MRIHTKFNGYEAGRRLYFKGGGGSVRYDNLEKLYEEQAASAGLLRGIAEQNLPGATQAYLNSVQAVTAPGYADRQAGIASADMASANAMERAATERNLASMGVNPNDPRFAGSLRSTQLNNAARMAAGKNATRREADQYQLNVAKDAVGTFTGQSNNAATQMGNAASGLGSIYTSQANQQMAKDQAQANAVGSIVGAGMTGYALYNGGYKDGGKVTGIGLKNIERHMLGGQAGSQQNQGFFQMQSIAPPPSARAPQQQQGGGINMNQVMMARKIAKDRAADQAADAAGKAFADDVAAKTVESTMPAAAEAAGTTAASTAAGNALTNAAGQTFAENVAANTASQFGATQGANALGSGLANTAATATADAAITGSITSGVGATGTGVATGLTSGAGAAAGAGAMGAIGAALPWVGAAYAVGSLLDWWNEGGKVGTQNPGMSEQEAIQRFQTGNVKDLRSGAPVSGKWQGNTDNVPAMLTEGEHVINAEAAKAIGHNTLEQLNKKGLEMRKQGLTPDSIRTLGLRGVMR